ncbi:MAG: MATE family efflux transporter [Bacteroidaceae bacterium]|nr:MATE family efflux transporter [Bacteroidaceae bacterium]
MTIKSDKENAETLLSLSWKRRASAIMHLALPIIIAQLGTILQSFADTIMVGQYGTAELSAAGFVNNIFTFVLYFILGLSYSTTPVVGMLWGKGEKTRARQTLNNSLVLSIVGCVVVMLLLLILYFNIDRLGQPAELMPLVRPYFIVILLSLPFVGAFNSFKQYSDATGDTRTPMWVMLISNVVNVIGNYLLIFILDLGLLGAGLATLFSRILMAVWMWWRIGAGRDVESRGVVYLAKKALPISTQLCLESGSFNVCALFMGWIGASALAAHQVMCVIGSLCFMTYYGMGAAAAIRISHYRGLEDYVEVRRTSSTAFVLTLALGVCLLGIVIAFHGSIFAAFTTSADVQAILVSLLPAFVAYQFGDCLQTIFANCLRAIEEVRSLMISAFIAYVVVSIPIAYLFAFPCGMGAVGIWWSFPIGLTLAGILFYLHFSRSSLK